MLQLDTVSLISFLTNFCSSQALKCLVLGPANLCERAHLQRSLQCFEFDANGAHGHLPLLAHFPALRQLSVVGTDAVACVGAPHCAAAQVQRGQHAAHGGAAWQPRFMPRLPSLEHEALFQPYTSAALSGHDSEAAAEVVVASLPELRRLQLSAPSAFHAALAHAIAARNSRRASFERCAVAWR